jgi:hypothetical protein
MMHHTKKIPQNNRYFFTTSASHKTSFCTTERIRSTEHSQAQLVIMGGIQVQLGQGTAKQMLVMQVMVIHACKGDAAFRT